MSRRPGDLVVGEPDKMSLGLQHDTMGVLDQGSDLDHHVEYIGRRAALVGLDEVRMLLRHLCAADPETLPAGGVDQSAALSPSGLVNTDPAF